MIPKKIKVTNSSFAEGWIHLDGKPFKLNDPAHNFFRPYLYTLYDSDFKNTLLMFARQCEKSTTLANRIITRSCLNSFHKSLYVTPTQMQTRVFVDDKLNPALASPAIKEFYRKNKGITDKIEEKELDNGSKIFLRYAFLSADRTRGITAKDICIDEIQDIITDNIPIIEECASHFPVEKRTLYSGTPKTFDSAIEFFWKKSTQCEWGIKCSACNTWNILGYDNIGDKFVMCSKCHCKIDPYKGRWISLNSSSDIHGFRVSQLMVPWIYSSEEGWKELISKRNKYPHGKFMNEVLAQAYDYGGKPITITDIKACCDESVTEWQQEFDQRTTMPVFAGIDIGTGEGEHPSYTILTIMQPQIDNTTKILFIKRYAGAEVDPGHQLNDMVKICRMHNVTFIGIDWGMSWMFRTELRKYFEPERVLCFEYSHNLSAKFRWNPQQLVFTCNRNETMTELIQRVKKKIIRFPAYRVVEPFASDLTSITSVTDAKGGLIYNHSISEPDDAFHSISYCHMAMDIFFNRRKYIFGPDSINS